MATTIRLILLLTAMLSGCARPSGRRAITDPILRHGTQEEFVPVGDRVFFDFDRATLKGNGPRTVNNIATPDQQAAWLKTHAWANVQVAGNCDERGTEEYNLALGDRRANADRSYLVSKGVEGARVTTPGSNEDAWAQNRNAVTAVR